MKRLLMVSGLLVAAGWGGFWSAGVEARTYDSQLFAQMQWRPIGPLRGGRGRAIAGVPSHPNVFYIGNDDGGV